MGVHEAEGLGGLRSSAAEAGHWRGECQCLALGQRHAILVVAQANPHLENESSVVPRNVGRGHVVGVDTKSGYVSVKAGTISQPIQKCVR